MNLLDKLDLMTNNVVIEPRKIFMSLPSKIPGYGYPRDVQREVWDKWFKIRHEKNIIIKMNTGSGKTVVGLMILQSSLNENKGPAIYVVPDNYLVSQVINEANNLGILATDNREDYNYANSKAILVTSIHSIVNGYSVFGMQSRNKNYPIGSIIIDDVHACINRIETQYIIRIDDDSKAYSEIIKVFSAIIKEYSPQRYIDIIELKDRRESILVPFWEWQEHYNDVYRILKKYENEKEIYYKLPLVDNCLETCDCIITASSIEITPKGIDIDKITSMANAERRIYMSATLADDSVFVSGLGLEENDLCNIITPEYANDIGDRLILFPKHLNNDITDEQIKNKVEDIANKYNVAILVPSFERANFWDPDKKYTVGKETIDQRVRLLKNGEYHGLTVFVNRYDGIDLPKDACRMLVIDGLPPLNSINKKYQQSIAPLNTTFVREQIQRIEQGMGRGVRSTDDECCIILMGDELSEVLTRKNGTDFFSIATKCQYDLSKKLWDLLVNEYPKPTVEQVFEIANYSLDRNPQWVTQCKNVLSSAKYSTELQIDNKELALRKAFVRGLNSQWKEAADCIEKVKNEEKDEKTKGYLLQIIAEYTNKYDKIFAQQVLRAGKKKNPAIISPLDGFEDIKLYNYQSQASNIQKVCISNDKDKNRIMSKVDAIISKLDFERDADVFEEAINDLGVYLGFICSRPDKETSGNGPDNFWATGDNNYIVIECKNKAETSEISKRYCDQLSGSINWFKRHYPNESKHNAIMIHPSRIVKDEASPDSEMRVMTENEVNKLKTALRKFYSGVCENSGFEDINKIIGLLQKNKLRRNDILNEYSVTFLRK